MSVLGKKKKTVKGGWRKGKGGIKNENEGEREEGGGRRDRKKRRKETDREDYAIVILDWIMDLKNKTLTAKQKQL